MKHVVEFAVCVEPLINTTIDGKQTTKLIKNDTTTSNKEFPIPREQHTNV